MYLCIFCIIIDVLIRKKILFPNFERKSFTAIGKLSNFGDVEFLVIFACSNEPNEISMEK